MVTKYAVEILISTPPLAITATVNTEGGTPVETEVRSPRLKALFEADKTDLGVWCDLALVSILPGAFWLEAPTDDQFFNGGPDADGVTRWSLTGTAAKGIS